MCKVRLNPITHKEIRYHQQIQPSFTVHKSEIEVIYHYYIADLSLIGNIFPESVLTAKFIMLKLVKKLVRNSSISFIVTAWKVNFYQLVISCLFGMEVTFQIS